MKYYANFDANNGTHWMHAIEGTNLKEMIRDIRGTAEAERFPGNACCWWVKDEEGRPVAMGGVTRSGRRYREI